MSTKPFTLKLKNLQVLEADETIFRGYMYTIGLLGVAFGTVKIANLNTIEVTHNDKVNKIRMDESFGYSVEFAEVVLEDLQVRLKTRWAELLKGGEEMLKRLAGFDNIDDVLTRENTYSASGVTLVFRRVLKDGEPEMQMRLTSEFQNFTLTTFDKKEFLVALASTARSFTRATYRQYAMPDKRWNHNNNQPVNPKEYAGDDKFQELERKKINVGTIGHIDPSLAGLQAMAAIATRDDGLKSTVVE